MFGKDEVRNMKHIEKKCLPEYYQAVRKRIKTFEIRKDDSDYEVGDILELYEWDGEKYTGHKIARQITYILRNAEQYGLQDGYCILAIQPIGWDDTEYTTSGQLVVQNGKVNEHIINTGAMTISFGR